MLLLASGYPLDGGVAVRGTHAVVPALAHPGVVVLDLSDKDAPRVASRAAAPDLGGLAALPVRGLLFAGGPDAEPVAAGQVYARTSAGFWTLELDAAGRAHVLPFTPIAGLERLRWDASSSRLIALTATGGAIAFVPRARVRPVPGASDAALGGAALAAARATPTATPRRARSEVGLTRCPDHFEKTAREIIGQHRSGKIENLLCSEFIAATGDGPLARWRVFTYTRRVNGEARPRPERVVYDIVKSRETRGFLVIDPAPAAEAGQGGGADGGTGPSASTPPGLAPAPAP